MEFIKNLADLQKSDLPQAGGKAANLGELLRAGLPVPPGFCVLTSAYRLFTCQHVLQEDILRLAATAEEAEPNELEAISHEIALLFERHPLPQELQAEIRQAYEVLCCATGRSLPLAVRSSATAEDLPDLSFAGQQDTYLNIIGIEALLQAVRRCWASLWTARALGYRAKNKISNREVSLAVVVQQLIPSEASGVMFTANPLNGCRLETVIDATWGLGEALVSGQVTPDHYEVEPKSGQIKVCRLGLNEISIRPGEGGGTRTEKSQPGAAQQVLPAEIILELAALGQKATAHFNTPQDLEWAQADGKLYLLQSRPITTLYPLRRNMQLHGRMKRGFFILFLPGRDCWNR